MKCSDYFRYIPPDIVLAISKYLIRKRIGHIILTVLSILLHQFESCQYSVETEKKKISSKESLPQQKTDSMFIF